MKIWGLHWRGAGRTVPSFPTSLGFVLLDCTNSEVSSTGIIPQHSCRCLLLCAGAGEPKPLVWAEAAGTGTASPPGALSLEQAQPLGAAQSILQLLPLLRA